jgi:hypothetical protein
MKEKSLQEDKMSGMKWLRGRAEVSPAVMVRRVVVPKTEELVESGRESLAAFNPVFARRFRCRCTTMTTTTTTTIH